MLPWRRGASPSRRGAEQAQPGASSGSGHAAARPKLLSPRPWSQGENGAPYLAAGALFSRGLIIVGPTLILFGMIVNLFAKMDFEDQRED